MLAFCREKFDVNDDDIQEDGMSSDVNCLLSYCYLCYFDFKFHIISLLDDGRSARPYGQNKIGKKWI